ncbi:peroxisomal membrane protein pex14 [Cystobasidiomycetes sp. EMM_F5]
MSTSSPPSSSNNGSIQSAVSFLQDPSVSSSPLTKRIAFLEAKGLSPGDIETALRLAGQSNGVSNSTGYGYSAQQLPYGQQFGGARYPIPPYPNERRPPDWRDWFIMAVVGGSVGAGLYSLARKYLVPALAPPSQTELQAAQDALTAKYDEAAAILESLQSDTQHIKQTLDEQTAKVEESVERVTQALDGVQEKERVRDEELDKIKDEVAALRGLVERMFDKHKDAQTSSLNEIQTELRSLKSLLGRRQDGPGQSKIESVGNASSSPNGRASPAINGSTRDRANGSTSPYATSVSGSGELPRPQFGLSASSTMHNLNGAGSSNNSGSSLPASRSFDHIMKRAPGIPAWQLQATRDSSGSGATSTPSTDPQPTIRPAESIASGDGSSAPLISDSPAVDVKRGVSPSQGQSDTSKLSESTDAVLVDSAGP